MPEDYRDQIRRLIDDAAPITDADIDAARARATGIAETEPPPARRRVVFAAAAALFVVLLLTVAAVAGLGDDENGEPEIGSTPPTTALPAVDADPLVTCAPNDPWFRSSALSGPVLTEDDPDPAVQALTRLLNSGPDPSVGPNAEWNLDPGWRMLASSDDKAFFGSGVLPSFFHVSVVRQPDGTWAPDGSGGGGCAPMLKPPEGMAYPSWMLDERAPPDPASTELALRVEAPPCVGPFTPEDLIGPDIIETPETVTIRMAITDPGENGEDAWDCETAVEQNPVDVVATLQAPLGERQILDGNHFPAIPVQIPYAAVESGADPTRIETPRGTVERGIEVSVNNGGTCGVAGDAGCRNNGQEAQIAIVVDGITTTGDTNAEGRATLVLPEDTDVRLDVSADGAWCPSIALSSALLTDPAPSLGSPTTAIRCTSLDHPHTTLIIDAEGAGDRPILFHQFASERMVTATTTGPDRLEVVLEPGTWALQIGNRAAATGFQPSCRPAAVTIEPGTDQTLRLLCS